MKTSLLKSVRQSATTDKGKLNRKVVSFIVCVLLATALWFMNALSKKYDESLTFYINYENMPQGQDKKLYPSSNTLQVKATLSGFRIMGYKLGITDAAINIDASQFRHSYYTLNSQKHLEKIQEQVGIPVVILGIAPDTLFLHNQPPSANDQN